MATKDYCLSFKEKRGNFVGDFSNGQYRNLNLNHNNRCFLEDTVISKNAVLNDRRKGGGYDLTGVNNLQKGKDSLLWCSFGHNLSSSDHFKRTFQLQKDPCQKEFDYQKKDSNKNSSSSSTLSLHITAYENSIENITSDPLISNKKVGLIKKWKNVNEYMLGLAIQTPFELPRQQDKDQNMDPEVMQFKASQQLFNPNNRPRKIATRRRTRNVMDAVEAMEVDDEPVRNQDVRNEFGKRRKERCEHSDPIDPKRFCVTMPEIIPSISPVSPSLPSIPSDSIQASFIQPPPSQPQEASTTDRQMSHTPQLPSNEPRFTSTPIAAYGIPRTTPPNVSQIHNLSVESDHFLTSTPIAAYGLPRVTSPNLSSIHNLSLEIQSDHYVLPLEPPTSNRQFKRHRIQVSPTSTESRKQSRYRQISETSVPRQPHRATMYATSSSSSSSNNIQQKRKKHHLQTRSSRHHTRRISPPAPLRSSASPSPTKHN